MNDYEKIRSFIEAKKLTIKAFCKLIEVSPSFFSSSKRKKSSATITSLAKIAEAFPDFDVVGFVLSENAQMWQKCISTPPQKIVKNQISQRLLTFFKEFKINSWALHLACGFGYGFMSSLQRGLAGFTTETLQKIFNGFPELSPHWLILGQGEMLKKGSQKPVNKTIEEIFSQHIQTMQETDQKWLANTQAMFNVVSGKLSKEQVLKLQKERKKIYAQILIQQQQLKKIIREYSESDERIS